MRIITWNCNMAFRRKAEVIFKYNPDILIIPECENLEKLHFNNKNIQPNDSYWYGDNPNKGLGVFVFGEYKIELIDSFNPNFKYVIPLRIYNDSESLIVLAVWTQKPTTNDFYVVQIYDAVNYYSELLNSQNVVIAGDFNSNSIWDKPKKNSNHSDMVEILKSKGILSTYHFINNQNHGEEDKMTLYLQRKIDKGYHIDYCFVSSDLLMKLESVEIGNYQDWSTLSDHKPLIVNFKNEKSRINELGKIHAEIKDGNEPLITNGNYTGYHLIDFWKWSVSDLLSNATRGRFAEFIVGTAIGCDMSLIRDEWDAFDLISKSGVKIEVKSAAYLQSWSQKNYSKISFSIKPAIVWNSITGEYSKTKLRSADIYVFCLLKHQDPKTINPLNTDQWEFYVVETSYINEFHTNANSISLGVLKRNFSPIKYEELSMLIEK